MKKLKVAMLFFCVFFWACKDTFSPEVDAQYKNLLVVEGFINIGEKSNLRLSRTSDLQDWQSIIPEKNADVMIEGDQGTLVQGTTDENGACTLNTESLILSERYKLKLSDSKGEKYQTDYLENIQSPEIDNLNFKVENKGFQVYLNTHDHTGETKYYNWDFLETWEIRSAFTSSFEYKNGKVVKRDENVNLTYCWSNNQSFSILLGSTERLSEDKITDFPITHVLGNSVKVAHMYSILVTQYGLTQQAYQYLQNLKKNTEQIGSIFDAQPSELKGNVICVSDPKRQVLGWISAGKVAQKRLFISSQDKPGVGYDWVYPMVCEPITVPSDSLLYFLGARNLIISENIKPPDINYTMAKEDCIDCRLRGSNIKPAYWPN